MVTFSEAEKKAALTNIGCKITEEMVDISTNVDETQMIKAVIVYDQKGVPCPFDWRGQYKHTAMLDMVFEEILKGQILRIVFSLPYSFQFPKK